MKKLITLLSLTLVIMSCSSSQKQNDEDIQVNLIFTSTSNYCGGAPPNDKIIQELKTPKPYANKDIMLSTENKLNDSMTTLSVNGEGKVSASLKQRTYYIFLPGKVYASYAAGGDEAQCKKWKNTPDGTFNVEKGTENVEIRVHITCDPCGAKRM